MILLKYMTDHLHGLCKNCIPICSQIFTSSRNQNQCSRCKEGEPTIIIQQQGVGVTMAICTRCYLKQQSSPPKKSILSHHRNNSQLTKTPFTLIKKQQILSKTGFFTSEGKMIKKIEKYFSKWQTIDEGLKELSKRTLLPSHFTWEKIVKHCEKAYSLVFILVGSNKNIFGWYHQETCKISEKGFLDNESGFFTSNRQIQFQYYKPIQECLVTYNPQSKSILLGKNSSPCCEIKMEGEDPKVKCDLIQNTNTEWIHQFLLKL